MIKISFKAFHQLFCSGGISHVQVVARALLTVSPAGQLD